MGFWYYCAPRCCGSLAYKWYGQSPAVNLRGRPSFIDRQSDWTFLSASRGTPIADSVVGVTLDGSLWHSESNFGEPIPFADSGPWLAACPYGGAGLGIKTDGTLWAWGGLPGNGELSSWGIWNGDYINAPYRRTSFNRVFSVPGGDRARISCSIEKFSSNGAVIGGDGLTVSLAGTELVSGGSPADFSYSLVNGNVFYVEVVSGGSGYQVPPAVSFDPPGATATAVVVDGVVTFIRVESPGGQYSVTPVVTVTAADGDAGDGCTAIAHIEGNVEVVIEDGGSGYTRNLSLASTDHRYWFEGTCANTFGGIIYDVSLESGGAGYFAPSPPSISLIGKGSGATAVASVNQDGGVSSVTVTDGGEGYCEAFAPNVSITGGQHAAAKAVVNSLGYVTLVNVINPGSGYSNGSVSVSFDPPATGLIATAKVVNGRIDSISVSGQTSPYLRAAPPSVVFSPNNGTVAAAIVRASHPFDVMSVAVQSPGAGHMSPAAPAVTLDTTTANLVQPHSGDDAVLRAVMNTDGSVRSVYIESPGSGYNVNSYPPASSLPLIFTPQVAGKGAGASGSAKAVSPYRWKLYYGHTGPVPVGSAVLSLGTLDSIELTSPIVLYSAGALFGWNAMPDWLINGSPSGQLVDYEFTTTHVDSQWVDLDGSTGILSQHTPTLEIGSPLTNQFTSVSPTSVTSAEYVNGTEKTYTFSGTVSVQYPSNKGKLTVTTKSSPGPTFGGALAGDGECTAIPDDNGMIGNWFKARLPSGFEDANTYPELLQGSGILFEDGILKKDTTVESAAPGGPWYSIPAPEPTESESVSYVAVGGEYRPAVLPLGTQARTIAANLSPDSLTSLINAKITAVLTSIDGLAHVSSFTVDDPGYGYEFEPTIWYSPETQTDGKYIPSQTLVQGHPWPIMGDTYDLYPSMQFSQITGSGWTDVVVIDLLLGPLCAGIQNGELYVWGNVEPYLSQMSGYGGYCFSPVKIETTNVPKPIQKIIPTPAGIWQGGVAVLNLLAGGKVWAINLGTSLAVGGGASTYEGDVIVSEEFNTWGFFYLGGWVTYNMSETVTQKQHVSYPSPDVYVVTVESGGLGYEQPPEISISGEGPIPIGSEPESEEFYYADCPLPEWGGALSRRTVTYRVFGESDAVPVNVSLGPFGLAIDDYGRVYTSGHAVIAVRSGTSPTATVTGDCDEPATVSMTKVTQPQAWGAYEWGIVGRIQDSVTSCAGGVIEATESGPRGTLGWLTSSPCGYECDGIEYVAGSYGSPNAAAWKSDGSLWVTNAKEARIQNELELKVSGEDGVGYAFLSNGGSGYKSSPTISFKGGSGSGAQATAIMSGNEQDGYTVSSVVITSPGSKYEYPPMIEFSGGSPSLQASATSVLLSGASSGMTLPPRVALSQASGVPTTSAKIDGKVVAFGVTDGGSLYTSAPAVSITASPGDAGSGAEGRAHVCTRVVSLKVDTGGSGYKHPPEVAFSRPGMPARATLNAAGGISGIVISKSGSGYSSPPEVSFAGTGTGAKATAKISGGVGSIIVTETGSGYKSSPTVTVSGGGGSGCTAVARLEGSETSGWTVSGVLITAPGADYTTAPTVTFSGGGATKQAEAIAVLDAGVLSITVDEPGSGYTNPTYVALPGGYAQASVDLDLSVTSASLQSGGRYWNSSPTAAVSVRPSLDKISVTAGGSKYQSPPDVLIVGGSGQGASATCKISGSVSKVVIEDAGLGYSPDYPPWVSLSGGYDLALGSQAKATASVGGDGKISAISITAPGEFYYSPPAVLLRWPEAASAYAEIDAAGQVSKINVINRGGFYAAPPRVVLVSQECDEQAEATATIQDGSVVSISVDKAGSGYKNPPGVSIEYDQYGVDFSGYAVLSASVSEVCLTSRGYGYEVSPVALFVGGGGTGATATVTTKAFGSGCEITPSASGSVEYIELTKRGSGYQVPPVVEVAPPADKNGRQATAQARILGRVISLSSPDADGKGCFLSPNVLPRAAYQLSLDPADREYFTVSKTGSLQAEKIGATVSTDGFYTGKSRDFFAAAPSVIYEEALGAFPVMRLTPAAYGVDHLDGGTIGKTMPSASATVESGVVSAIEVTGQGNVSTSASLIALISPPQQAWGSQAAAAVSYNTEESRWQVEVTDPGSGYISPPVVSFYDTGNTGYPRATSQQPVRFFQRTSPYKSYETWQGPLLEDQYVVSGLSIPISNANKPTAVLENEKGSKAQFDITYATSSLGLTSLKIADGGAEYLSRYDDGDPVVTLLNVSSASRFASPPTVVAEISGGSVSQLEVTNQGQWPSSVAAAIYLSGGGGSGASGTLVYANGQWIASLTNGGSGYSSAPIVTVVDQQPFEKQVSIMPQSITSSLPIVRAEVSGGQVSSMTVAFQGSKTASESPTGTLYFSGGGGSGASGTIEYVDGEWVATVTSGGSGYTSPPSVSVFISSPLLSLGVSLSASDARLEFVSQAIPVVPFDSNVIPEPTSGAHVFFKDGRMVDIWSAHYQSFGLLGWSDSRWSKGFIRQHATPPTITITTHDNAAPQANASIVKWLPPETDGTAIRDTTQ